MPINARNSTVSKATALTTAQSGARRKYFHFGNKLVTKTNAVNYMSQVSSGFTPETVYIPSYCIPEAGVITSLYFRMTSDADQDAIITTFKNGVATTQTCTVAGAGSVYAASDLANPITFAAGDTVGVKIGLAAAPAADLADCYAVLQFDPT